MCYTKIEDQLKSLRLKHTLFLILTHCIYVASVISMLGILYSQYICIYIYIYIYIYINGIVQ